MCLYRDIPVLQDKDNEKVDLDTQTFHEDVDSFLNASSAHDENTGHHNDSTADGRVETGEANGEATGEAAGEATATGEATGVELDASKTQDGLNGETDTNSMLGGSGERDGPRDETDTDAVLAINGAQREGQGDSSTVTTTEMQVDTPAAAHTPHVETDSMHDTGSAASASADNAGGTTQRDIPLWITEAKQYFFSIQAGDEWKKLVNHWMDMEKRLGYPDGSVSCFYSTALK
jgi:hypothetical protein